MKILRPPFLPPMLFVTVLLAYATDAGAAPFFKPHLPDFYQHQKGGTGWQTEDDNDILKVRPGLGVPPGIGNSLPPADAPKPATVPSYNLGPRWWEDGGGWCCLTAFVNSFYFIEQQYGYDGLFTRSPRTPDPANWLTDMIFAIEDFAEDVLYGPLGLRDHMRKLKVESDRKILAAGGTPKPTLTYDEFDDEGGRIVVRPIDFVSAVNAGLIILDATGNVIADNRPQDDVSDEFANMLAVYQKELCRSEDVTVRLEFPGGTATNAWWRDSFHVVTGAGMDDCNDKNFKKNRTIWVADPDQRNLQPGEAAPPGVDPSPGGVRRPYDPAHGLPVPAPADRGAFYNQLTFDMNGIIISDQFKGARIVQITAISVPAPSTLGLLMAAAAVLAGLCGIRRARVLRP